MSASDSTLKLRVIIDPTSTRKVVLPSRPETVTDLLLHLKTNLNVSYAFRLQFEDPEFGNALCDLENIDDLPSKATVKLIKTLELDIHSTDTEDTALASDTSSSSSKRTSRWPDVFDLPTFSYDVEFALREGNSEYFKEGKHLKLTRDQKHNILERMIDTIYSFKAYPSDTEFAQAAEALVTKHPCLKENGSRTGHDGWKVSLKFKMGNYRSKLRRSGMQEVAINGCKRSRSNPDAEHSCANIKRPRRAEVNFLPNLPHGSDELSLEDLRLNMMDELKKKDQDVMMINRHMQQTFALRRKEIVQPSPSVKEMMSR
ncbi:uncharacterized protein LOC143741580 [Siphateles boraxobius]|uniref:uncharacterized protein LOC143741580 n=1 Tax=Siphateles boraxobius TaxID=180520 RepID=UPI004063B02A